ncbi:hypothetical protein SCUCBS95973_005001 [Sporothrix curviconia]|uniref:Uncharacterized protein n=1 Tax=Sporothrix curviconia TaxID=1260050 RepID=A0ABP0BTE6_9PEZI
MEAVHLMMRGLAPNLANAWLDGPIAFGRPEWPGFFLNGQTEQEKNLDHGASAEALRCLRFELTPELEIFAAQNMANLRRLHINWTRRIGQVLADLAVGGHLPHLEMLSLLRMNSATQPA